MNYLQKYGVLLSLFFLLLVSFTILPRLASAELIPGAFVTTWKTDNPGVSASNQIKIDINSSYVGQYNYNIDWGDGLSNPGVTGSITHTYATPDTYTVSITGDFPAMYFENYWTELASDNKKLLSVEQWGSIVWKSMDAAFADASNMVMTAKDNPNLTEVTSLSNMFQGASSFNQDISDWDVSHVTTMNQMFYSATAFNNGDQPLTWKVSNVTNMNSLFAVATSFNQKINTWDVSRVTNMSQMFSSATAFNQDISDWNVSSVKYMNRMFFDATAFNQNISTWDVSSVTTMEKMFEGVTLSTSIYDSILKSWSTLDLIDGVIFSAGNSINASSEAEKQLIIETYHWTITDGGFLYPNITGANLLNKALTLTFDQILDNSSVPDMNSFSFFHKDNLHFDDFNNVNPNVIFPEYSPDYGEIDNFKTTSGILTVNDFKEDWTFFVIDPDVNITENSTISARIRYNTTEPDTSLKYFYLTTTNDGSGTDSTESDIVNEWVDLSVTMTENSEFISIDAEGLSLGDSIDIDWVKIMSAPITSSVNINNVSTPTNYTVILTLDETLSSDTDNFISYTKPPESNFILGKDMYPTPSFEYFPVDLEEVTIVAPTVTTNSATEVTQNSAILHGTISNTGGEEVTSVGFKYGKDESHGTDIPGTLEGSSFTGTVTDLTCGTIYYYEAFASNSEDTGYSGNQTFTTSDCRHHSSSGSSAAAIALFQARQQGTTSPVITTPTYNLGTTPIKLGQRNTFVKELQKFLNINLKLNLIEDGIFGQKTKTAVISFQKANGLTPDGIVGPMTKGKIK